MQSTSLAFSADTLAMPVGRWTIGVFGAVDSKRVCHFSVQAQSYGTVIFLSLLSLLSLSSFS